MALKIDVIKWRCGDYFKPHFQSKDKHMNPIEFKKLSKQHFYNALYRAYRDNTRHIFRLYSLVAEELDSDEKAKIFALFDLQMEAEKAVDLMSIPYRPIGEKNE